MAEPLRGELWNAEVTAADYAGAGEKYQNAVLEQYKIYVEMADRVSARRAVANTFFLTLNTSVSAVLSGLWAGQPVARAWWLVIPLAALVSECAAWFYLVRSYRRLNSAKYKVVGELEERLPASPYWNAEWSALGHGEDRKLYSPLTHLEKWVPIIFAVIYVAGFVAMVLA